MDWLTTDDLTVFLAVSFISVYALSRFLKPQSLVHPLLLGRQADVSRVRFPGESAVYRNYATGLMGRLPERPKPEIKLLGNLVQDSHNSSRTLWSTNITNADLKERAWAFGTGLTQVAGLTPRESTALLLLNDSIDFLIADLALASHSIVSYTLTSLSLLIPALEKYAPTVIIAQEQVLKHVLESHLDSRLLARHSIIVLGDGTAPLQTYDIKFLRWEDLEAKGKTLPKSTIPVPEHSDVFSVSLYGQEDGELLGAQLSHANVTAGVTAAHLLFPFSEPISQSDTLFSTFSMAGSFGRAIAYTALYEGANFNSVATPLPLGIDDSKGSVATLLVRSCEGSPTSPTLLFLTPNHLKLLTGSILEAAKSNPLFGLAWRHKLAALQEGFVTNKSFWDNLVLKSARAKVLGRLEATLRGIVVSEGHLENAAVEPSKIAFSIPIVNALSHPLVCGPVMASHPLDLQSFPGDFETHATAAHVGPPAPNVEVKLVGVVDTHVEQGKDPIGDLLVRGPPVAQCDPGIGGSHEEWVSTGLKACAQKNGTFKLH